MDVVSACPLRVASLVWQPRAGAFTLTVVCKATFTLAPGESPLADEQDDPFEDDVHWNDDERRSLAAATDLAPYKRRAEVIVVGHAHAPGQQPVSSLLVRVLIGDVDKSIRVIGDRHFSQEGQITEPARFTRMPLTWERAGGGPETANPAGVRPDAWPDARGRVACPNLFTPGMHLVERGTYVEPTGLGPVAPTWPGRLAWLHHHAGGWDHRHPGQRPLPADIDPRYFNAAPPDQQLEELDPGARIVLENLHREHPRLVTRLAPVAPQAIATFADGSTRELRFRADTLWIDADRGIGAITFRAAMELAHPALPGRVVVTVPAMAWDTAETADRLEAPRPGLGLVLGTAALGRNSQPPEPEPPERDGVPPSQQTLVRAMAIPAPALPFRPEVGGIEDPATFDDSGRGLAGSALPFQREPRGSVEDLGTFDGHAEDVRTLPFASPAMRAALPFVPAAYGVPAVPVPAPPVAPVAPMTSWSPQALPFVPFSQYGAAPVGLGSAVLPPAPIVVPAPVPPAHVVDAPPAMVGPLATPEMYVASVAPEEAPAPEPEPEPVAPVPAGPPPLPLDAFSVDRCATIAAALAHRPPDRARILERHELSPELWARLDEHWTRELRAEADRGKRALLSVYDAAYVAELERLRGPIRVEEYAGLLVAAERGQADKALSELDLPRGGVLRVKRVWLVRCAEDLALGASLRGAVEDARDA